jgi:tyrosyl-tRNA synthetase
MPIQQSPASPDLKSDFLRTLAERGFIHQCSDMSALDHRLQQGPIAGYNGFDLTADSLHVGHLIPITMLRWLQRPGHRPIVLMGGGTTRIGDPSFRDASRPLLDDGQIAKNLTGIRRVFDRFLRFGDDSTGAAVVNNADWIGDLGYLDFLRGFGRYFSVSRMLSFDSVRSRLEREQSLSLLEFNYMVIQAYDFLELARTHDCILQLGASDQWGNIVNGVELGRRVAGRELFGLTAPLLATASGAKMGKSASGAVWLNAERLSPYEFWQFWRNTADADVGRFLRLFTELPLGETVRLDALGGEEINDAKKILADEVTALCHGEAASRQAHETARCAFEQKAAAEGLPTVDIERSGLRAGISIADLLLRTGLSPSKSAARRLIAGGGVRVDDTAVTDAAAVLSETAIGHGAIRLPAGRKRHARVRIA